jgi:hypothetical protein
MRSFTAVVETPLPPEEAFAALTDWPAHGRHVPLTRVRVLHEAGGVGTTFRGRTGLGRLAFDDDMRVTVWEPPRDGGPGSAAVVKTGRVRGGAQIEVEPVGTGSRVRWTEQIGFGPRWLAPLVDRATVLPGRLVFGRVTRGLLRDRERQGGAGG